MSRPEQLRGDSLRRQLALSDAYAAEHKLTLDTTFRDLGVSALRGKHRTHGALSRFLTAIGEGRIERGSYLLIENLDRLSREEVPDALNLFLSIIGAGVTIVTLSDGQVYSAKVIRDDYTKLLVSIIFMARAHDESSQKARRLGAAWENKRDVARSAGGKKLTGRAPAWLQLSADGLKFELIAERAQVVRRIFDEATSGVGALKIAKRLNDDTVATFGRSAGWHESYVKKILGNEAVIGVMQPQTRVEGKRVPSGEPIVDYFPPVVPKDLFWRAQEAQQTRRSGGGRKGEAFGNLFTGLAKCAQCGGPMHYLDKGAKPKGGRYLQCDRARRNAGCDFKKLFSYPNVEYAFLFGLSQVDLDSLIGDKKETEERHRRELAELDGQLSRKKRRLERLVGMLEVEDDAEADSVGDALEERIKSLRREIAGLSRSRTDHAKKLNMAAAASTAGDENFWRSLQSYISHLNEQTDNAEIFLLRASLSVRVKEIVDSLIFRKSSISVKYRNGGISLIPLSAMVFVGKDGKLDLLMNENVDRAEFETLVRDAEYYYAISQGEVYWDSRSRDGKIDELFEYPFVPSVIATPEEWGNVAKGINQTI
jgi:DNA invertase Pin-like site-specific DNA recombinase